MTKCCREQNLARDQSSNFQQGTKKRWYLTGFGNQHNFMLLAVAGNNTICKTVPFHTEILNWQWDAVKRFMGEQN